MKPKGYPESEKRGVQKALLVWSGQRKLTTQTVISLSVYLEQVEVLSEVDPGF